MPAKLPDWPTDTASHETQDVGSVLATSRPLPRFRLEPVKPVGERAWESSGETCAIGSHAANQIVIADPTVSRFHCEVRCELDGVRAVDLDSRNGTVIDGVRVRDGFLRDGSILTLGAAALRFRTTSETVTLPMAGRTELGGMVGRSVAMRTAFALIERAAATDATVLLEGETGTGKGAAAEAIARGGSRRDLPFQVVDCGAIPGNLLETELFGHEKGAFTGADARRIGAFEDAGAGTVFLDEIGELPAELQPKLLRAIENREIRRVGSNKYVPVQMRLIAATHRDLRSEVNAGTFRADLYYRLAVLRIPLPALRQRPEDIPMISERLLDALGASAEDRETLLTPPFVSALQHAAWPGNVRELRNHLERCLVFERPLPVGEHGDQLVSTAPDPALPYAEARRRALQDFERRYTEGLLVLHGGNVSRAAEAAGLGRTYLHELLQRHRKR